MILHKAGSDGAPGRGFCVASATRRFWQKQHRAWRGVFRVERGPHGNIIVRFGAQSYFQRSGHGAICDLRLGRLVMWADPRTCKPFHFSIR